MRFAAVWRTFVRSPLAIGASVAALGAWTRLYSHAADVETGGLILGAAGRDDRWWLSLAMLTVAEVDAAVDAGLVEWRGADLIVHGYDLEGEAKVRSRRANGRLGGRPKANAKPNAKPKGNHVVSTRLDKPSTKRITKSEPPSGSDPLPDPIPFRSLSKDGETPESDPEPPRSSLTLSDPDPTTPAFLAVYDRYPSKVGKNAASQIFRELAETYPGGGNALSEAILSAFDRGMLRSRPYCRDEKDGVRYCPGLARFLGGRLWEDEIPESDQSNGRKAVPYG